MKIHELLTDTSKWTQKTLALTAKGVGVKSSHPEACSWCLLGACIKCYGIEKADNEITAQIRAKLGCGLVSWNDSPNRTFEEVRALVLELDI